MEKSIVLGQESSIHVNDEETTAVEQSVDGDDDKHGVSESNIDETTTNEPSKRRRLSSDSSHIEMRTTRDFRRRTFRKSNFSDLFKDKLFKAGFVYLSHPSNATLCMYCDITCYEWNPDIDDPMFVHKALSPGCYFTTNKFKKNKLSVDDRQYHQAKPAHRDFLDGATRLESFGDFPDAKKFADAGFYRIGDIAECFYCDGSCPIADFKFHPVLEHIQRFPHCAYAKHLCGPILYRKVRRAIENEKFGEGNETNRTVLSDATNSPTIEIAGPTWEVFRDESTNDPKDKSLRSKIENSQRRSFKENRIKTPRVEMMKKLDEIDFPSSTEENSSNEDSNEVVERFEDITQSFPHELEKYQNEQKKSALGFVEDSSVARRREFEGKNSSYRGPALCQFVDSGWTFSRSGQATKCLNCGIEFNCWKPSDDPISIHQAVSPRCLFALALNLSRQHRMKVRNNAIPVVTPANINDDVSLRQMMASHEAIVSSPVHFEHFKRQETFGNVLRNSSTSAENLARAGWFYLPSSRMIECFYCHSRSILPTDNRQIPEHRPDCNYHRQMTVKDPFQSERSKSGKCEWCESGEVSHAVLPCWHFSMCEACCKVRYHCHRCWQPAAAFMKFYR